MFGLRQILKALGEKDTITFKELVDKMDISHSSLKRYLYELRRYGIAHIEGDKIYIDKDKAKAVLEVLEENPRALKTVAEFFEKRGLVVKVKEVTTTNPSGLLLIYGIDNPTEAQRELIYKYLSEGYEGFGVLVPISRYGDFIYRITSVTKAMGLDVKLIPVGNGKLLIIEVPQFVPQFEKE